MPRIILAAVAAAMTVLLLTTPSQAQPSTAPGATTQLEEIATLEQQSQETYAAEEWVAFYIANMKLSQLRPYESEYMVNIIRACALLDRKSTAYHFMLKMQQQGLSYDFNSTEDTLLIRDTEAYEYINKLLIEAGNPSGVATEAFTLPASPAEFQAIAWDESRSSFLVGTLREGAVMAVSADGETSVLLKADDENGLMAISDLAVDADRKRLWVSSAASARFSGYSATDDKDGALFEFDLETLELLGRYDFSTDGLEHEPGGLAVTDDGHVYVINRVAPIIYRKTPTGNQLEAFFTSLELTALSDITAVQDNSRVFVSDTYKGVYAIDPIAERAAPLGGPETMNLGGIEGIEYSNGMLFLIQGGISPQRVIRLELDANGAVAQSISPMAIALEDFNQPGGGTLHGESLYYFANSGDGEAAQTIVMSTPLDAGVQVAPPDMKQFEEAMRERQLQTKD